MRHLDLFSGIGGFAYAAQQVWGDEHEVVAFCEIDKFCQKVLKKHWPDTPIIDDIRNINEWITTNTSFNGLQRRMAKQRQTRESSREIKMGRKADLLTGGFPCQPFSVAGKRKGKDDERYLWGEMLEVIRHTMPTWVIAENVRGILTIDEGMVFEQVCSGLENEGYEVQSIVIPACAVNAPHRRDRVWFLAHSVNSGVRRWNNGDSGRMQCALQTERPDSDASNTCHAGLEGSDKSQKNSREDRAGQEGTHGGIGQLRNIQHIGQWEENWIEVATRFCRVDDGVSNRVDRLKALGNAIVPQVAMVIMQAIKEINV